MSNTHVQIYCYTTKGFIGEAISKAGLIAELMFDVMRRKDSLLPSPLTKHNIKGIDHSGYECETSFQLFILLRIHNLYSYILIYIIHRSYCNQYDLLVLSIIEFLRIFQGWYQRERNIMNIFQTGNYVRRINLMRKPTAEIACEVISSIDEDHKQ